VHVDRQGIEADHQFGRLQPAAGPDLGPLGVLDLPAGGGNVDRLFDQPGDVGAGTSAGRADGDLRMGGSASAQAAAICTNVSEPRT
jgi:hypothetical protein